MQLKTLLNKCHPLKRFVYGSVRFVTEDGRSFLVVDIEPEGQRPSGLFVLRGARSRLRPGEGAEAVPVRSDPRLAGLISATGCAGCGAPRCGVKVERVPWAEGKSPQTKAYQLFPGPVGAAAELEGDRGGVQDQLGLRLHGRAGGGRLRPVATAAWAASKRSGWTNPVAQRPRLRHPGLSDRRRIEKAAACRPAPHHGVPFGFFRTCWAGRLLRRSDTSARTCGNPTFKSSPKRPRRPCTCWTASTSWPTCRRRSTRSGPRRPRKMKAEGSRRRAQTHQVHVS